MSDELAQSLGFESAAEFFRLVAGVDLANPGALKRFMDWQENDGTKAGLLELPQRPSPPKEQREAR